MAIRYTAEEIASYPPRNWEMEVVAVVDKPDSQLRIYHKFMPNGERWNFLTVCGRTMGPSWVTWAQVLKLGLKPCRQCYRKAT